MASTRSSGLEGGESERRYGLCNSASFHQSWSILLDDPRSARWSSPARGGHPGGAGDQSPPAHWQGRRCGRSRSDTRDSRSLAATSPCSIPRAHWPGVSDVLIDYHALGDRRLSDGSLRRPRFRNSPGRTLRAAGRTTCPNTRVNQLIAAWGVEVTREVLASSAEAVECRAPRYPVALKVTRHTFCTRPRPAPFAWACQSADEVRRAYTEIMARAACPFPGRDRLRLLVQEMVAEG